MRKALLWIVGLGLVGWWLWPRAYIDPPPQFLESQIVTPLGMNNQPFGEITVGEFTTFLTKKKLTNGTFPAVLGWTQDDNVYTLYLDTTEGQSDFTFVHLLNYDGRFSALEGGARVLARELRR